MPITFNEHAAWNGRNAGDHRWAGSSTLHKVIASAVAAIHDAYEATIGDKGKH